MKVGQNIMCEVSSKQDIVKLVLRQLQHTPYYM